MSIVRDDTGPRAMRAFKADRTNIRPNPAEAMQLVVLALLLSHASATVLGDAAAAAVQQQAARDAAHTSVADLAKQQTPESVRLYLLADNGARMWPPPTIGPDLIAARVLGKGIDCRLQHAVLLDSFLSANISFNTTMHHEIPAAQLPPAALCGADTGVLTAGVYTLQASMADGLNGPYWQCFIAHPDEHSASEAVNISVKLTGVAMLSPQVVQLEAGNTYVCVATYSQQSKEQQAAIAAISWPKIVATAYSSVSTSANSSTSCAVPAYKQPVRGRPPPPLKTNQWEIVNARTGTRVIFRGLNW